MTKKKSDLAIENPPPPGSGGFRYDQVFAEFAAREELKERWQKALHAADIQEPALLIALMVEHAPTELLPGLTDFLNFKLGKNPAGRPPKPTWKESNPLETASQAVDWLLAAAQRRASAVAGARRLTPEKAMAKVAQTPLAEGKGITLEKLRAYRQSGHGKRLRRERLRLKPLSTVWGSE